MHISLLVLAGLAITSSSPQLLQLAQAQPQPCGGAAFAKVGTTFYIQGGSTFQDELIQAFWALDLSSPWTTSSPAWSALSPPGPYNAFHSAGVSSDGSSFITFGRDTAASNNQVAASWVNTFNIGSKTWSAATPPQVADPSRRDFYAVTNLAGSKIYIMGGNSGPSGSVSTNVLNTYDPATGTMNEAPMPASAPQNSSTYAAVWIKRSATMLMMGGVTTGGYPQSLWSYNPTSGGWATQASSGPFSQNRISHCAASNADGSLVAVFGGFVGGASTADPNAYILNTNTWTWTVIPLASGRGRGNAACTIIDDTFIIWGGFYNNPSVAGGLPTGVDNLLLLKLSTGQWTTSYTPSMAAGGAGNGGSGNGTSGGMGGNGGTGDGNGGLSGGVIGGICAGVAVVVAVVAFLFYRRSSKKGDYTVAASSAKLESGSHGAHHPPAPPCTGGGPTNGHGHHHNGSGAAPTAAGAAVAGAAAGHIPSNHHNHSPQPPAPSTTASPTVYDQSLYHQQQPQPQQVGYAGYDPHQQQYPPYLQQAPDQTFHHRPSTDIAYSSAGAPGGDAQYVDENGNLYRRSYQPEAVPAPVPSPGTVYYPPPPPSGSSGVGTPEQGAYQAAYGQGQGGEAPYKALVGEGGAPRVDASPYHDSYGVAGSATTAAKRPVGGPQGGPFIEVPVTKGAPQAILQ
ncbi:hypothetical protein EC957_001320 [Mortierella hygrophila]|uniref:Attractin/MKLN-like beta-propeller domain-containing protein n=1 Tax=Mortierella hygrophila TaxID=979708 RepID=A0A9P6F5V5_9FUNG|nr:hypothetical protein EC957_001320 [Mortierella hygrophila]